MRSVLKRSSTLDPVLAPFFDGSFITFDHEVSFWHVKSKDDIRVNGDGTDGIIHEMVHFVEIDERRMDKPIWGLDFGVFVPTPGNKYSAGYRMYLGTADIERELRVIAWQTNVCKALGIDGKSKFWLSSLQHVPGYENLSFSRHQIARSKRSEWCRRQHEKHIADPRFTYENFIAEWWRRNRILLKRRKRRQAKTERIACAA